MDEVVCIYSIIPNNKNYKQNKKLLTVFVTWFLYSTVKLVHTNRLAILCVFQLDEFNKSVTKDIQDSEIKVIHYYIIIHKLLYDNTYIFNPRWRQEKTLGPCLLK